MNFKLLSHKIIKSKKNGKEYIIADLYYDNNVLIKSFNEYDELFEQFLISNEYQDISEYVSLRYNDNIKGFIPVIRYK